MVLTLAVTAMLAQTPAPAQTQGVQQRNAARPVVCILQTPTTATKISNKNLAVDLHPMTEEERTLYPGRERFDKTEWYESQFKSAKVVTNPEHVDEWNNGGIDAA